jgi:hypothetical protein
MRAQFAAALNARPVIEFVTHGPFLTRNLTRNTGHRNRSYLLSLRGAKRRSNPYFLCGKMDCFASLAMTVGLLRGACHRARIRATRWLAMTGETLIRRKTIKQAVAAGALQHAAAIIIPAPRHRHEKAPRSEPRRRYRQGVADNQVCWMAESSQLDPRGRTKVHTSVTSAGASLPATSLPLLRSRVLSTSENRIATLA